MTSHQVRQFLVSKLGHLGDAVGPNRLDNLLVFHGQGSSCSGCIAEALWIETRQLLPGLFQQHCDGLPTSIAHFAKSPQSVGKVLGLLLSFRKDMLHLLGQGIPQLALAPRAAQRYEAPGAVGHTLWPKLAGHLNGCCLQLLNQMAAEE